MTDIQHDDLLPSDGIHVPIRWPEFADEAARLAQSVTSADVSGLAFQSDTKTLYYLADTTPTWVVSGGVSSYVRLATDRSESAGTASDVTGLSFPVVSGTTYAFDFGVVVRTAVQTCGPHLALNGPSFSQFCAYVQCPSSAGTHGDLNIIAYDVFDAVTQLPAANADYFAMIRGVITPSANGTLIVRLKSEVSGTAVTVRSGSYGQLLRI